MRVLAVFILLLFFVSAGAYSKEFFVGRNGEVRVKNFDAKVTQDSRSKIFHLSAEVGGGNKCSKGQLFIVFSLNKNTSIGSMTIPFKDYDGYFMKVKDYRRYSKKVNIKDYYISSVQFACFIK